MIGGRRVYREGLAQIHMSSEPETGSWGLAGGYDSRVSTRLVLYIK